MGIQCRIIRDDKGKVSYVEAPNGNRSQLYDDAVAKVGEDSALDVVLTAYTPSFTEEIKNPKIAEYRRQLVETINSIPSATNTISLQLEEVDYNIDPSTLEMVTEDLGNGETLVSFTASLAARETARLAPNGAESNLSATQYAEVRTPEFMEWSNNWNDVVKDENGEPLVHFHGTVEDRFTEFNSPQGINFFTPIRKIAELYAGFEQTNPDSMYEVYVKSPKTFDPRQEIPQEIRNFIDKNWKAIKDQTSYIVRTKKAEVLDKIYDILQNQEYSWEIMETPVFLDFLRDNGYTGLRTSEQGGRSIGIFDNTAVKSAEENVGTFDSTNPDIRYQQSQVRDVAPSELLKGLTDKLKASGLAKKVNIVSEAKIKKVLEKAGQVYQQGTNGFVIGDTVYLNKDSASLDTPIHEFGHLWNSWMQTNAPKIFERGIELIKTEAGEPYIAIAKASQPNLEGDALYEEALAQAIGDNGAKIVNEAHKNTFKEWLGRLWRAVQGAVGLADTKLVDFQNLSLNDFAQRAATDLLSGESLSSLMNAPQGSVGEKFTLRDKAPMKFTRLRERFNFNLPFVTEIPIRSMEDVIREFEGRVFGITSDATGTGYDSKGNPIYGGIGFMAIAQNVKDGIGFASLDEATVIKTVGKLKARYKAGDKVAMLVMIQNPSATLGNGHGAQYFGRGLKLLKEQRTEEEYNAIVDSVRDYIINSASLNKEFITKYKNKAERENFLDAFTNLMRNADRYSEIEFGNEFLKDSTFNGRKELLKSIIPNRVDFGNDITALTAAFRQLEFTHVEFLKEFGEGTLFEEEIYNVDEGGFFAGGFEFTIPESDEALRELVRSVQSKGITHSTFNGKFPTTGQSWFFDGLYPVDENFAIFGKKESEINEDALSQEEKDALARKLFPKDTHYDTDYREGSSKFMPMSERGYTQLTSGNSIKFKKYLAENMPNTLRYKLPKSNVWIAKGLGYSPYSEQDRLDLVDKATTGEFIRYSRTPQQAEAKTEQYLDRINKEVRDNPKQYWSVDIPSRDEVYDAAINDRIVDVRGGMAIVTNTGDIKGVFKYVHNLKGVGQEILQESLRKGGIKLDNFDGYLTKVYEKAGFKVASRLEFNEEFAPSEWDKEAHGTPDVVFMVYDPNGQLDVTEKKFDKDNYEGALEYRDDYVREGLELNKTGQTQGFFSDVVTGKSDKFKAKKEWQPILPFSGRELGFKAIYDKFKGNFDNHIATSIPTFRETQIKVGSAIRSLLAPAPTAFNEQLRDVRDEYVSDKNLEKKEPLYTAIDDSLFTEIAEHHAKIKDDRQNPTMVKSYRAFLNETKEQYQYLIDAGYTIEPWMGEGEPYGVDSQAVREDVINNKHLYYLRSKSATGDNSDADTADTYMPFESSGITINGDDVLMNDLFRAVHDIFGHVSANNSFSPQGELNAYKTHSVMYSDTAQKALFLETVVYNAAYRETGNYAPRKIYNIPTKFMEGINRKPLVYDIGGSEGGFVKAITEESNGAVESVNLDLNPDMRDAHNKVPVEGSEFVLEAFYEGYTDDSTGVTYKRHRPSRKADVVHESMVFQFISPKRKEFIKEVKNNYLTEDGIALFEEKLSTYQEEVWLANERKKNEYKSQYYSQEELTQKQEEVLVGMKENQTYREEFLEILKDNFLFVEEYWDSGNFKGYLATDSAAKRDVFLAKIGGRITSEYSENQAKTKFPVGFIQTKSTPQGEQVILSNVDDQMQGQGLGTEMYKKTASSLAAQGKPMMADFNSKGAAGIWNKMRSAGITEPVDVNGQVTERVKLTPESFDYNGEPNVNDVIQFIQSKNYEGQTLSEAEANEVRNVLMGTGLQGSEDLYNALRRGFTPDGIYNPSENSLMASGLYSRVEARKLLSSTDAQLKAYEMMHKIKNSEPIANNIDVDASYITVSSQYNSLGLMKKANPFINQKTAREILGGIKDETLFQNQAEANNLDFASKKFDELSGLTRLPVVKVTNGRTSPHTNLDTLRTRLEETLTLPTNQKLVKNLDYLLSVPNDVWNMEFQNVRTILSEIEGNAVDIGLDLSNLNEESYDKTPKEVKDLLSAVRNFAVLQNESTFEVLMYGYANFFDIAERPDTATMKIAPAMEGKTLLYSDTKESSYDLFTNNGLLPLGNNVYQKVNTNKSLNEVYDIVYQTIRSGKNILPKSAFKTEYDVTSPANEEYVRQDIVNYANEASKEIENSRDFDPDTLRKMVLFSAFFRAKLKNEVDSPSVSNELDLIASYPSNAEYLTTEYISDFNKQMLKEKVKNSEKYNNFYKHFDISSEGIELVNTDPITMREIQPYLTDDLVNHFRLKKNGINLSEGTTEGLIEGTNEVVMRNYYSNFPQALPLYKGTYQMDNGILVTNTNPDFIRVDEGLFEYVETVGSKSLYVSLPVNNSPYKIYDREYRTPELGDISKFNVSQGVKADKKVNHLYTKAQGTNITNEIDNC